MEGLENRALSKIPEKSCPAQHTGEDGISDHGCFGFQVLYALTAGIAGYVAAVTYKILGGTSWVRNTLLTATLFCGPLLVTFSFLNTVAIVYRSTAALPFGTIVIILVIWAAVTFPLTVLGGIAGKNSKVCHLLSWLLPLHASCIVETRGVKPWIQYLPIVVCGLAKKEGSWVVHL